MCNPSSASLIFTIASFSTIPTLLYHSPASPAKESHSSLPTRRVRLLLHLRKHLPLCPYSRIGFQTARLSSRLTPPTIPSPPFSPSSRKTTSYIPSLSTPVHFPLPNSTLTSTTRSSLLSTKHSAFGATTLKVPWLLLTTLPTTKILNIS